MAKEHTIPLFGYDGVISEIDDTTATPGELFHNHIKLATSIALKYYNGHCRNLDTDYRSDLVMVALGKLWDCASNGAYNPSLQRFHNYAHKAILNKLREHHTYYGATIGVPRPNSERETMANRLMHREGINREEALAQLLKEGKTVIGHTEPLPTMIRESLPVDGGVAERVGERVSVWDYIGDNSAQDYGDEAIASVFSEQMYEFVRDERSREVLRRLMSGEETLEGIGESMGLTRERIRQIKEAALNEIRRKLCKGGRSLEQLRSVLL